MSHCPLPGIKREDMTDMKGLSLNDNWHGEFKNSKKGFTVPNIGQFHLHGHIHSPNSGKSQKILDRQFDVGVVANNYIPVNISVLESWIALTLNKS
jgi:calcineurin-like phosphoesterase family protein